jgi:hypothetical protein
MWCDCAVCATCRYHSVTTHPRFGLYRNTSPLWKLGPRSGCLARRDSLGKAFESAVKKKREGTKRKGKGGAERKRSSDEEDDGEVAASPKALPPAAGAGAGAGALLLEHGADGIAADAAITAQLPDPYDVRGELIPRHCHFYKRYKTYTVVCMTRRVSFCR